MPNIIRVKLDVTKILKEHLFIGKNGAKYLDVALLPVRESKYGETHVALQDLPRELRDKGQKGPILGNATEKLPDGYQEDAPATGHRGSSGPAKTKPAPADNIDEDIPFAPERM